MSLGQLLTNYFKKIFIEKEKKKAINILITFYISHIII